jgi:hypothetical protein
MRYAHRRVPKAFKPLRDLLNLYLGHNTSGEKFIMASGFCYSELIPDHAIDVWLMEWYMMTGFRGSKFKVQGRAIPISMMTRRYMEPSRALLLYPLGDGCSWPKLSKNNCGLY